MYKTEMYIHFSVEVDDKTGVEIIHVIDRFYNEYDAKEAMRKRLHSECDDDLDN